MADTETETPAAASSPVSMFRRAKENLWLLTVVFGLGTAHMQLQGLNATATKTEGRVDRLEQTFDKRLDQLEQGVQVLLERTAKPK